MNIRSIYPGVANIQTCVGEANGIWYTWNRFKGTDLKPHPHGSRAEALEVYDSMTRLFSKLDQNAESIEAALEVRLDTLLEDEAEYYDEY